MAIIKALSNYAECHGNPQEGQTKSSVWGRQESTREMLTFELDSKGVLKLGRTFQAEGIIAWIKAKKSQRG